MMGVKLLDKLSYSKDAILTTNYANDYIVRGYGFGIEDTAEITAGASAYFLFDPTALVNKSVIFLPIEACTTLEDIEFVIYEDTDYTGGATVTPRNLNRNFSDSLDSVITLGATGSDKGTQLKKRVATSDKKAGGRLGEGSLTILDVTKKYLIEIKNLGTGTTTVCYQSLFYEF